MEGDLPKAAHRSNEQKAQGYLGAARDALRKARFFAPADSDQAGLIDRLIATMDEAE